MAGPRTVITTADIPDEYGLSSDSLRGSHQFIRPDLIDNQDSRDAYTGRPTPRATLSHNEIVALENTGMLVDENGYEREPEPVVQAAPIPLVQPRVRKRDAAPAGNIDTTGIDTSDRYPSEDMYASGASRPTEYPKPNDPRRVGPTYDLGPQDAPSDPVDRDRARSEATIAADRARAQSQTLPPPFGTPPVPPTGSTDVG